MKNVTTHETSAALKAAGFPQPEPEAGQVWYLDAGDAVFINGINARGEIICAAPSLINIEGHFVFNPDACESMPFAPTAADILRELFVAVNSMRAEGYAVGIDIDFWITENQWVCQISEDLPFDVMPTILGTGETLAEACAAAWLELKKQVAKSG